MNYFLFLWNYLVHFKDLNEHLLMHIYDILKINIKKPASIFKFRAFRCEFVLGVQYVLFVKELPELLMVSLYMFEVESYKRVNRRKYCYFICFVI